MANRVTPSTVTGGAAAGWSSSDARGLASWGSVWRLLATAMPLTIASTIALGTWWLGLRVVALTVTL